MRSTTSTVGREIELVRKYVEILNVRLGHRLTFDINVPARLEEMSLPPMMLLPLVDHAIVHGLEQSRADGTISASVDLQDE
jgi:sensor histidine kinase YesM